MQILVGVLHKTENTPPTSIGPAPPPLVSSVGQRSHTLIAASNEWGDLTRWWMGWIHFSCTLLLTCTKLDSGRKLRGSRSLLESFSSRLRESCVWLESGDVLSLEHPHGVRMGRLLFSFSFVINGYGLEHRGGCFGPFLGRLFYCAGTLSALVFIAKLPCKNNVFLFSWFGWTLD